MPSSYAALYGTQGDEWHHLARGCNVPRHVVPSDRARPPPQAPPPSLLPFSHCCHSLRYHHQRAMVPPLFGPAHAGRWGIGKQRKPKVVCGLCVAVRYVSHVGGLQRFITGGELLDAFKHFSWVSDKEGVLTVIERRVYFWPCRAQSVINTLSCIWVCLYSLEPSAGVIYLNSKCVSQVGV